MIPGSLLQTTIRKTRGAYEIENSVRLDGVGDMSRTVGSDGDLREWSWSFWVKRSGLGTNGGLGFNIGGTYTDASNRSIVRFYSSGNGTDDFYWAERSGGAWREDQWTLAQYRDPSAWYHILLVWDTDGGTTPRARRYINGVQITDLGSSPAAAANVDSGTNKAGTFQLFDQAGFPGREFEGYCAEMHFVDGTALAPTDFGEFNTDGVWIPKQVTGITYGSNGFYLDFADSSDLGKDVSGNGNNFTSSGLTSADQVLDSPTDNQSTYNVITGPTISSPAYSEGNTRVVNSSETGADNYRGSIGVSSGKWYVEFLITDVGAGENVGVGVVDSETPVKNPLGAGNSPIGFAANSYEMIPSGSKVNNGSASAYGSSYTNGDVMGIALDMDNGAIWFSKNDTWQASATQSEIEAGTTTNAAFTGVTGTKHFASGFSAGVARSADVTMRPEADWTGTCPSGFKALSTANLDDPTIADPSAHFQTTTYAGTGSTRSVNQSGNSTFEPGFVWIKVRDAAYDHAVYDQVRGVTKEIKSNATDAEATIATGLTAFESDGFQVGSRLGVNDGTKNFVAWQWKANGAGSSNTDGSITSTVSANQTAGFSIVTATQSGSSGIHSFGHGLGVKPSMFIVKNRDILQNWQIWNKNLASETDSYLQFNTSAVQTFATMWGAAPTSTTFSMHTAGPVSAGDDFVAYCFAEVEGFSKFGSYTGNGSTDGPFIYTGFRPAFIFYKNITTVGTNWDILDNTRETYNTVGQQLFANLNNAEAAEDHRWDFLSNGFKARDGSASNNQSGATIIYAAFAESPFKYANAR